MSVENIPQPKRTSNYAPDTGTFTNAVLDTVSAIVVVLDSGGRIARLNRAGCVLTGYSEDEVIGKHVWDFLLIPEEIEKVRGIYSELLSGKFPKFPRELLGCQRWPPPDGRLVEYRSARRGRSRGIRHRHRH